MKSVIIIYGPPGSGKGTQAQRVAEHFSFEHFDTGQILEQTVHDPTKQDDPIIQREKKLFDEGILCTPEWVTEVVRKAIKKFHSQEKGLIFSGSPRTVYEAENLVPLLEELYSPENIFIIRLLIRPETSIFRNSHRRVCQKCGQPLFYTPENEKLTQCPLCGGKLVRRTLDDPEDIKVRLKEYENRTKPVFKFMEEHGYQIIKIDGEPSIKEVTKSVLEKLPIKR